MHISRSRLFFTLAVLLAINTMNFFDRQILPAVQEKIRKDWALSDSELGMLGTAFILLYAVVGLPLGRWADVGRRKWLLAAGVGLWSLMTLGSGLAWSFASLFVFRLGVGVGEASCAPAANSLIGDLVPPERRARALAVFMLGLPFGLALSFLVSGSIAERWNWQSAFYVAGIPGLLLAVLALFIAEPVRGSAETEGHRIKEGVNGEGGERKTTEREAVASRSPVHPFTPSVGEQPSFLFVVRRVLAVPTMWWIIASGALHNFNMYALGSFVASFLKRYHSVNVEQAGQISGMIFGVGALGIFAAGWLGDRAFHRGVSGRLHIAWVGVAGAIPCLLLALAAPAGEWGVCALWLLLAYLLLYTYYGTVYATIQDLFQPSLRGMAMAIYFCAMYLLGAVFGPVATGKLSDHYALRAAAADPVNVQAFAASTVGLIGSPLGQGPLLAGATAFPGRDALVADRHRAVGLHDAMYVIPILNIALVGVLFAASRTVERDYRRRRENTADCADARGDG